jgi:hypothetical protein
MRAFCYIAPASLVGVDRRFRGACCLHHQGEDYHAPLKRQSTPTTLNGTISQKDLIFIRAAVGTLISLNSYCLCVWISLSILLQPSHARRHARMHTSTHAHAHWKADMEMIFKSGSCHGKYLLHTAGLFCEPADYVVQYNVHFVINGMLSNSSSR